MCRRLVAVVVVAGWCKSPNAIPFGAFVTRLLGLEVSERKGPICPPSSEGGESPAALVEGEGPSSNSASSDMKLGMGMPLALFRGGKMDSPLGGVGPVLEKLLLPGWATGTDLEAGCDCDLSELPAPDVPASAAALDRCRLLLNSVGAPVVAAGVDGYVPYT